MKLDLSMVVNLSVRTFTQLFMGAGILCAIGSTAAALEPQFYPNQKYNTTAAGQVGQDVAGCKSQAQSYLQGSGQKGGVAREGAKSAARGAALGALAGTITDNNAGRAAGAGAAIGGIKGVAKGRRESGEGSPEYQKFATACLEERGYKVVGWK